MAEGYRGPHRAQPVTNTTAGVESYRGYSCWRYVAITATKSEGSLELAKAR